MKQVPADELNRRLFTFQEKMNEKNPDWRVTVIFSNIHLYYFTGTMQKGMLMIERDRQAIFWVFRSYERALDESNFSDIRPMSSYRDAAKEYSLQNEKIYMETEIVSIGFFNRFNNYFGFSEYISIDSILAGIRSVKSEYEISLMKKSGEIHQKVIEHKVPELIRVGMTELELATKVWNLLLEEGHHGVSRIGMFDTELLFGIVSFGENSLYPTNFNGPGGNVGLGPHVPLLASRDRKLQKNEIAFVDIGCGYEGYQTDKTMIYSIGKNQDEAVLEGHERCVQIQSQIAEMLVPGAIPSQIYQTILEGLDDSFIKNFMGYGNRRVNFLGHGIGLWIDEAPVIAKGFNEPLQNNMAFALEPKKGFEGIGMVGTENTFIVSKDGGKCITGDRINWIVI